MVLLPELTVCLPVRDRVATWLNREEHPFHYVIPGSFHRPGADGTWVNEAVILDRYGETVLVQHKLAPMYYRAGEEYERIEGQKTLNLLCTSFGVLSVGICLDFCDDNFQTLWKDAAPDLALVPSMSLKTTLNAHKRRADYLFRQNGTITAAALQAPPGTSVGEFTTGYFRTDRHHEQSRTPGQSVCLWVNHCKPI
jgi:predicted amidohydrolase